MHRSTSEAILNIVDSTGSCKQSVELFKGIKQLKTDRIFIYSRGFVPIPLLRPHSSPRCGGSIYWVHKFIENNILLNTSWVTFDYLDSSHLCDMGQEFDVSCLSAVIQAVKKLNPQAQLTLVGMCRGAHAIIRYLANTNDSSVDTIILESPYATGQQLMSAIAQNHVAPYIGNATAQTLCNMLFKLHYPNFDKAQDNLLESIESISNKKIFIGHGLSDKIIMLEDINNLVDRLAISNDVYFHLSDYLPGEGHGSLTFSPSFGNAVNTFGIQCSLLSETKLAVA